MKKLICAGFIVLFLLTACSFGGKSESAAVAALEATRVAQFAAATAKAAAESMATSAVPPTTAPTETVAVPPTETATSEPTATPTEIPVVKAVSNANANCRSGPDKVFPLVELLNAGTSTLVIGQYGSNGQWWKVRTDAGKDCWVLGDNVSVSGDISIVAMLESPSTPTPPPPPSWDGYWKILFSDNPTNPEENASVINIYIKQTGNTISTNFTSGSGYAISAGGTVSADGMSVSGWLSYSGTNYVLRFYRLSANLNQFQGKFWSASNPGKDGAFCGGTNGQTYPSPCRW